MDDIAVFDHVLATVHALLIEEGLQDAAILVRSSPANVERTGWDNWNGGINLWTVSFSLAPHEYAKLGARRAGLEDQISKRLEVVLAQTTEDSYSVRIVPLILVEPNWREAPVVLSEGARRNIIDIFNLEKISWSGRLNEVEFLARLFDLAQLPSSDSRFKDAASDIWQHRVNNADDWDDNWVFFDDRFNLLKGSTEVFLRLLCETVHPVVRPDRGRALFLVGLFNDQLRPENWELFEDEKIAGRPWFAFRRQGGNKERAVSRART